MYTEKLIKAISDRTGVDISKFDMNELVMGMDVELEHGSTNDKTDVTGDDPEATFKIVMAHMHEMPDYYTKLKAMENKEENISEYARRMRELAGLSEGNQNKSLKTINEGNSSFEGGQTFYAKDMMGSDVVSEEFDGEFPKDDGAGPVEGEEFTPHGSYTVSNSGGYEIMLSDDGDSAKVRDAYGNDNPKTSDWLEIEYVDGGEGEQEPVIDPNGYNIPLNQVMRINENNSPANTDVEIHLPALRLKFPGASDEELRNIYSAMLMNESKSKEEEFETHKFEQRAIEEGEDDKELYNLNENTIIVLDFLDEEDK